MDPNSPTTSHDIAVDALMDISNTLGDSPVQKKQKKNPSLDDFLRLPSNHDEASSTDDDSDSESSEESVDHEEIKVLDQGNPESHSVGAQVP